METEVFTLTMPVRASLVRLLCVDRYTNTVLKTVCYVISEALTPLAELTSRRRQTGSDALVAHPSQASTSSKLLEPRDVVANK
jgi:hypothetical protein